MHVLIIGGAGYIGSHVARQFLDEGHAVTVFDDLSSGRRENLFAEAAFVQGDIRVAGELDRAFASSARYDGAVHLAALKAAGVSMTDPGSFRHHEPQRHHQRAQRVGPARGAPAGVFVERGGLR